MNVWKTATALCLAGGLVVGCCCSGGLPMREDAAFAADSGSDDWLHAEGNKLYDMDGNEVWLTGCNWFGFNVGSQVFDGVWSQNMYAMLTQIADHGLTFCASRCTQILLQWKNEIRIRHREGQRHQQPGAYRDGQLAALESGTGMV